MGSEMCIRDSYRSVESVEQGTVVLNFTESEKVFDPEVVYPGADNPTKL